MGLPHTSSSDSVHRRYFIPKGALIFANIWSILHDSEVYPEPEECRPERFLHDGHLHDGRKRLSLSFGAGRRALLTFASHAIHAFSQLTP
ncbi:p450-domain-containing protein [Heliocybe sulcata]|uniref:p450-domain-containing protein n=1 Tax=Heliocybe sulcata TaxID=5364 RepID=A0A5C3NEZ9_9AGAM|nr:p450-domain-containing protein [Heliocybe sulcata]